MDVTAQLDRSERLLRPLLQAKTGRKSEQLSREQLALFLTEAGRTQPEPEAPQDDSDQEPPATARAAHLIPEQFDHTVVHSIVMRRNNSALTQINKLNQVLLLDRCSEQLINVWCNRFPLGHPLPFLINHGLVFTGCLQPSSKNTTDHRSKSHPGRPDVSHFVSKD